MNQILTHEQARVVVNVIHTLASVGGQPGRFAIADGAIRVRCRKDGSIDVVQIDGDGKVLASRRYSSLSYFIGQHAEAA